jgi:hypothetical protein
LEGWPNEVRKARPKIHEERGIEGRGLPSIRKKREWMGHGALLTGQCRIPGFKLKLLSLPHEEKCDAHYLGISRDRVWIILSSFSGGGNRVRFQQ